MPLFTHSCTMNFPLFGLTFPAWNIPIPITFTRLVWVCNNKKQDLNIISYWQFVASKTRITSWNGCKKYHLHGDQNHCPSRHCNQHLLCEHVQRKGAHCLFEKGEMFYYYKLQYNQCSY